MEENENYTIVNMLYHMKYNIIVKNNKVRYITTNIYLKSIKVKKVKKAKKAKKAKRSIRYNRRVIYPK